MSTYVMNCKIVFPKREERNEIVLKFIESVRIESSWKLLTDKATITLPRNLLQKAFEKHDVKNAFRRGDKVEIYLGYYNKAAQNDGLIKEFSGYITHVSADVPIKIKCEDEMWKLKQIAVNYSSPNITLKKLLQEILPGYVIDANEGEQLGAVRFSETTVSEVLDKLKQEKGIYTYFKKEQLVSGKIYADDTNQPTHDFKLEYNVVSNNLQYRLKEDLKILVVARYFVKGVKKEFKIGDKGGEVYKFNYVGDSNTDLQKIKQKAQEDYQRLKRDGFDGSFTVFGIPSVHHGEKVNFESRLYGDRNGVYYIESVTKTFSQSGYRQQIKIGGKVI